MKNGKRYFLDIATGEEFSMEADENENDLLVVGRYRFSRHSFEKAIGILSSVIDRPGWLIIDEIGPLELRDQGFSGILKEILARRKHKCLLVIRQSLKQEILDHFSIDPAAVKFSAKDIYSYI